MTANPEEWMVRCCNLALWHPNEPPRSATVWATAIDQAEAVALARAQAPGLDVYMATRTSPDE